MEDFDPSRYELEVARILAMDGNGQRLMPLACGECSCPEARQLLKTSQAARLFPGVHEAEPAMAGLWLYFSCFEEAHELLNDCKSPEGHLWHAILHRQEPDSGNAAYWFRRAGAHPMFAKLARAAAEILKRFPDAEFRTSRRGWDPFAFVAFCDRARMQPGSMQETAAREIQRAEWQILFDHSARPQ
jgi:hypothetical protein